MGRLVAGRGGTRGRVGRLVLPLLGVVAACGAPPRATDPTATAGAAIAQAVPLEPVRLGVVPTVGDATWTRLLPEFPPSIAMTRYVTGYTDNAFELPLVVLEPTAFERATVRAAAPELALAVVGRHGLAAWADADGWAVARLGGWRALGEFERPPGSTTVPAWTGALSSGAHTAGALTYGADGYTVRALTVGAAAVARDGVAASPAAVRAETVVALGAAPMVAALADWEGSAGHCFAWITWQGSGMVVERRCDPLDHGPLGPGALGAQRWDVVGLSESLGLAAGPEAALVIDSDGDVVVHAAGPTDVLWPASGAPFVTPVVTLPAAGPYRGLARTDDWLVTATASGVLALALPAGPGAAWTPLAGAPVCPLGASVQQGPEHVAWLLCTTADDVSVWQVGP